MENSKRNKKLLSIGEFAELYSISRKSLRIYHDMGLLIPEYVDSQTGYRYYTPQQFPQLETILQMRSMGISLNNIHLLLQKRDIVFCETLLGMRFDELSAQIAALTTIRNAVGKQINSIKFLRNPPIYDKFIVEYIPSRNALFFDTVPYNLAETGSINPNWNDALTQVRILLTEYSVPFSSFQKIGCVVKAEDFAGEQLICSGAFILDDDVDKSLPFYRSIPAGTYLVVYRECAATDGPYEAQCLHEMLDFINTNNLKIIGPYMGEVVAEASIFACNDKNIIIRQQIRIENELKL